jgi:hypothetical protein
VKNLISCLIVGLSLLITTQCTNPNKPAKEDSSRMDEVAEKNGFNSFENSLSAPSPEEVMSLFEDSGLEYNASALNAPENISKYLKSNSLSLNLGVYATDAAYLNMFKQYSLMTRYLESIFTITDKLEIVGIYQDFDYKKVLLEVDNQDSLIFLSEGIYQSLNEYMIETNNEPMLCLISHGSFIELMYLSLESIKAFNPEDPILQSISDQYMYLDNLYEYAVQFQDNADIQGMLTQLATLKDIWSQLEQTEKQHIVSKDSNGKTAVKGGKKHTVTEAQFIKLKEAVKEIRTSITL